MKERAKTTAPDNKRRKLVNARKRAKQKTRENLVRVVEGYGPVFEEDPGPDWEDDPFQDQYLFH